MNARVKKAGHQRRPSSASLSPPPPPVPPHTPIHLTHPPVSVLTTATACVESLQAYPELPTCSAWGERPWCESNITPPSMPWCELISAPATRDPRPQDPRVPEVDDALHDPYCPSMCPASRTLAPSTREPQPRSPLSTLARVPNDGARLLAHRRQARPAPPNSSAMHKAPVPSPTITSDMQLSNKWV